MKEDEAVLVPNESLNLLQLFCSRISHDVRTPLGILLGLIDDLREGHELSREELDDSGYALKRIQQLADLLRDIGTPLVEVAGEGTDVRAVVEIAKAKYGSPEFGLELTEAQVGIVRNVNLLQRAIGLFLFFCRSWSLVEAGSTPVVGLRVAETGARLELEFCIREVNTEIIPLLQAAHSLADLAQRDYKISSLPLIFLDQLSNLSGIDSAVSTGSRGELLIRVGLPN